VQQYLLNIIQPERPTPSRDELRTIMTDVEMLDAEMRDAGVLVFSGGLHAPNTSTVFEPREDDVDTREGPYDASTGQLGGLVVIQAPDSTVALEWARRLAVATTQPVEVRAFQNEGDRVR